MKEILEKLSSYNLFNYLLPGIVFAVLADKMTRFSFVQKDMVIGAFVYYFIGLVLSRVGSLAIEPVLKRLAFIRYSVYKDFVAASKADTKIEVLLEQCNSYRTLCALFGSLLLLKGYDSLSAIYPVLVKWESMVLVVLLFIMFLFAYRKQSGYITQRVAANRPEQAKGANA